MAFCGLQVLGHVLSDFFLILYINLLFLLAKLNSPNSLLLAERNLKEAMPVFFLSPSKLPLHYRQYIHFQFENYITTFFDTIDKIVSSKVDVVRLCTKSSGQNKFQSLKYKKN